MIVPTQSPIQSTVDMSWNNTVLYLLYIYRVFETGFIVYVVFGFTSVS